MNIVKKNNKVYFKKILKRNITKIKKINFNYKELKKIFKIIDIKGKKIFNKNKLSRIKRKNFFNFKKLNYS